jgi:lipid-binding SYLF domain-containing protein
MGWGAQIGAEVTDFVILLNSNSAVDAFAGQKQVCVSVSGLEDAASA